MESTSFNNLLEVPVYNLSRGMYVAELDIPWLESPFAVQGFYVHTDEDIARVAEHCSTVYVDPRRMTRDDAQTSASDTVYSDSVSMRDEFLQVETDFESVNDTVQKTFDRVARGGILDLMGLESAIGPMVESVLRNKHALAALVRLKRKNSYGYSHSIATAVWAAILGRHVGLDKQRLANLALGASLIDIGKVKIPSPMLERPTKLTDTEEALMRRHVEFGVELLEEQMVDFEIRLVVEAHHERHDGSGYPNGLSGVNIPLEARIAGIADSYDAMITARPYAEARSSFEAMQELADLKDVKFQGPLVEQFMQAVGLFPTGSIVELNSGEVGIVVAQNPTRRLKPKVVIALDAEKNHVPDFHTVDLAAFSNDSDAPLWISRELEPGAHGIVEKDFFL